MASSLSRGLAKAHSVVPVACAAVGLLVAVPQASIAGATPTISTVAGSLGVGAPLNVQLTTAAMVVRGNLLYIADPTWHVVRRLDRRARRLDVVAGNGSDATFGDGGPALAAGVQQPSALTVTPDGSLLIGQRDGLVRRVGPEGRITTVAGGGSQRDPLLSAAATTVKLDTVTGLAVASNGDVLITELQRVRRLAPDGTLTTLAGGDEHGDSGDGGPARLATFMGLSGVVVGPDGSVYVADNGAGRIRRIDGLGLIATFAGNGTNKLGSEANTGDGGPATAARLSYPRSPVFDRAGNLLVPTWTAVRRISPDGVASTVYRGGGAVLLALGADGTIYSTDTLRVARGLGKDAVRIAGLGVRRLEGVRARDAQLPPLVAVDVSSQGLLLADDLDVIHRIDGAGKFRAWFDFSAAASRLPVDPRNPPAGAFAQLGDFTVDGDGTVYVLDGSLLNSALYRYDRRGRITAVVSGNGSDSCFGERGGDGGPGRDAALCQAQGLAVRDGVVLIADTEASRVRMVDTRGRITTVAGHYAVNDDVPGPDFGEGYSGDGGPGKQARLSRPEAVAWGPGRSVLIADTGNNAVRQVDSRGIIRTLTGSIAAPIDVAVTRGGTVYVLSRAGRVYRIRNGSITVVAGSALPGYSGDGGDALKARIGGTTAVVLSLDERVLYLNDPSSHRIRAVRLP